MSAKREHIVIGMEHYNPLGLIRSLGENGIHPVYIAIKHKSEVASKSKYVSRVHPVNDIHEAYDVLVSEYAHSDGEKPFVYTTDDDIQSLLDLNYDELKDDFIFFNCGEVGRTTEFMDKKKILEAAESCGLDVLPTIVVDKGTVPEGLEYPIITKAISPNDGGWKSDVFICGSSEELEEAFRFIESGRVLLQRYVDKDTEICFEGFSIDGGRQAFLPFYTTYNYNIDGYYSPYMTVHGTDLPEGFLNSVRSLIAKIGFEGIFEIEFLVDKEGKLFFSEINFRNSTWSYISTVLGMPIPYLWSKAMVFGSIPEDAYRDIPQGFTAMVEPIDHRKRVVEGDTDLADWLVDFRNADCLFYLDEEDREPFREMVRNWDALS